jgi:fumarylacetoacetase
MNSLLDETHDPRLESWVASANAPETDFPIQNLPFGRFRRVLATGAAGFRLGTAIGDCVLDLEQAGLVAGQDMQGLLRAPRNERGALRQRLSRALRRGSTSQARLAAALLPAAEVEMGMPCEIGDYTDFYAGIHHARTVGALLRPENPLLPNYKWVPIGYHGRASSIDVSPSRLVRPWGQRRGPDAHSPPGFKPTARLDYELELGWFVGPGNARGEPIPMAHAEDHLFGVVLFNDWSARDIQGWEYQPLGPFLGKSFASTISPWIVTLDALAPFRTAPVRPPEDPQPLPYLDSPANRTHGAIDIRLEARLQTAAMRAAGLAGDRLSESNFTDSYWTAAQLLTHHASNGCNLRPGDLLGTGTLSGPRPEQGGSLLELSQGGTRAVPLSNGEERRFLEDGDCVVFRAWCERPGTRRIGLAECRGIVEPARAPWG